MKILLFSFLNTLLACGQQTYDQKLNSLYKKTVPTIKPAQLDSLRAIDNLTILDTRSPEEYKVSHIKDAEFVNYDKFKVDQFQQADKEKPIIIYCSVGYRSERIGEKLLERGYKNVYNLYGGIFQWKNEGYPVYKEDKITEEVHAYNRLWGRWLEDDKAIKVYD
ncbi:rhodanese-like domain-containing protein [Marivirga lumbricoides]|uniref:rhodanese-like domain-containing protein n=1 Tax=Marivirga lumbricoides TaxID=1046115 RepID=UPI001E5CB8EA